jgi:hypothetical protein
LRKDALDILQADGGKIIGGQTAGLAVKIRPPGKWWMRFRGKMCFSPLAPRPLTLGVCLWYNEMMADCHGCAQGDIAFAVTCRARVFCNISDGLPLKGTLLHSQHGCIRFAWEISSSLCISRGKFADICILRVLEGSYILCPPDIHVFELQKFTSSSGNGTSSGKGALLLPPPRWPTACTWENLNDGLPL